MIFFSTFKQLLFKMINKIRILLFLFISNSALAQSVMEIPLYSGIIPGSKESAVKERQIVLANGGIRIYSVTLPTLKKYTPAKPNGVSVIICPGGGYERLSIDHEGEDVAKALNEFGITGFVLKYRLPNDSIMTDKTTGPLQDAQQAIRMVREQAVAWGLNPDRIGIMGFSAGGHLASTAATHFNFIADSTLKDTTSVRPDFAVLIYPVISFNDSIAHKGSKNRLLGKEPSAGQSIFFSNELQVTKNSPPVFLVHAGDDGTVPVENSIRYYQACIKNKVPAEMHLYPKGGHGFGLNNKTTADKWLDRLINWMNALQ